MGIPPDPHDDGSDQLAAESYRRGARRRRVWLALAAAGGVLLILAHWVLHLL